MLHRLTARLALLTCALTLNACGFHLVQSNALGNSLHVQVVNQSAPLASRTLSQELQLRQYAITGANPDIVLTLRGEQVDNRLLAIDSDLRAAEYQLEHSLEVSAKTPGGRSQWQRFTATRDYTYDESNVLGKSQEQLLIRQTLRDELAQRIVERFITPAQVEQLAQRSATAAVQ